MSNNWIYETCKIIICNALILTSLVVLMAIKFKVVVDTIIEKELRKEKEKKNDRNN